MIRAFIAKYEVYFGIIVLAVMFALGWHVHGTFIEAAHEKALQAQIEQHTAAEKLANDKSAQLEKDLAEARKKNAVIDDKVKNEVKKPAYNCIVPVNGRLLINSALASNASR